MPDEPIEPTGAESVEPAPDEIQQVIRDYIAAGAVDGARAAARRLMDAVQVPLDEVLDTLTALGPGPKEITSTGSLNMGSMGIAGTGTVVHLPTARVGASAFPLSVTVSQQEVSTALDEIRTIRESDVEKLSSRVPVKLSKPQLVCVALLVIFDVYLALPPETQQYLLDWGTLIQAVAAIIDLLGRL